MAPQLTTALVLVFTSPAIAAPSAAAGLPSDKRDEVVRTLRNAGADVVVRDGKVVRVGLKFHFDHRYFELISELTDLRELHLMYGKSVTDEMLAGVGNLTKLERLYLPTGISDAGFRHLKPLRKLQLLHINDGRMTDAGLSVLRNMPDMRDLSLWRCRRLTGKGLKNLSGMKQLRRLDLRRSDAIADDGMPHLAGLTQLEILDISILPRVTDKGFGRLKSLSKLRMLGLAGTGIRNLRVLRNFKRLESLSVPKEIGDDQLPHVGRLTGLQRLSLEVCDGITDKGVKQLEPLKQLDWLDLHRTQVSDRGIESLKKLPRLRYVQLQHTRVTAEGVDDLRRELPKCEIVK